MASSSGASGSLCPVMIVAGLRAATASMDESHAARDSGVEFHSHMWMLL